MPGPILHQGATVQCPHGGRAEPSSAFTRVLVGGLPVTVQPVPYLVTGCALAPPPAANGPCATAAWSTASLRVLAGGAPVLLADSRATTVPSGTPLAVAAVQQRVVAS
ncbi:DUF4280 domain-containing protein [Streptomyces hirsutus]|uniref:DUF4280 domain-containing protein n=1 Tax=Streptomyces hirsutus TaxID=35620 RepID=A0ABZ1GHW3_9ACTN|nr:hypothetical protein [Streptomyces hirsutus]WSD04911.1 DUF4280 domain-containing protein [Streptomyces hirsutus]WTD21696.1 DUF4280 domain-containing protein [Streptomyces hirsutus]